jgi:hypothetical protein
VSGDTLHDDNRLRSGAGLTGFLFAVGLSITWQKILTTQSLALTLAWIRWLERPPTPAASLDSGFTEAGLLGLSVVWYSLAVLLIFFAALCADEGVQRGAPAKLTYFGTLAIASFAVALILPYVEGWLGSPDVPPGNDWPRNIVNAIDVGIYGGFAMWIYLNRRSCNRMMNGVRNAERRRAQLERELLDSRIAGTQARIDPRTLFATLENIRNDFQNCAPDADVKLETLIQRLRAALGRAADGPSGAVQS